MTLPIGKKNPRNKATRETRVRTGFTLIELILVILIISIITSLSLPLFRRTFSDLVFKNASFNMAQMINYAREMAIIEKKTYKLNMDSENNKYWITRYNPSAEEAGYEKIKGRYGKEHFMPRGLGLSFDKKEIIFYPDGRSDEAGIKISDEKTRETRILRVKGFGSRVKIEEIDR